MTGIVPAVIALSSVLAGATPVAITVHAGYAMQCGWPGPRIVIVFPAAERLPARIGPDTVRVNGKPAAAARRSGSAVTLTIARPRGAMCDSIGPATVGIVFTRAARIGNPRRSGRYRLTVRHGDEAVSGAFSIR